MFRLVLDLMGNIPVFGEVFDGMNSLIYLGRGDRINAAASFAAIVPIIGGVAKYGIKNGGHLALGLGDDLFAFAKVKNFDTYKAFSTGFQKDKILDAMKGYDNIHFNVTGFSKYQFSKFKPNQPLSYKNYTNWEMHTIFNDPSLLNKTTFYKKSGNSYEILSNFSPFGY